MVTDIFSNLVPPINYFSAATTQICYYEFSLRFDDMMIHKNKSTKNLKFC